MLAVLACLRAAEAEAVKRQLLDAKSTLQAERAERTREQAAGAQVLVGVRRRCCCASRLASWRQALS